MATCADHQAEECVSAEYSSFQSHLADLFDGIHEPVRLSYRLCAAGLLSRDTRRKICELTLTEQRVSVLLDAIETMISMNPQNFYKFVDELEKDSPMQHLCDKLRSTCAQLKFTQLVSSVTLPPNTSAQQVREHDNMLPSSSSSQSTTAVTRNQYRVFLKDCYRQPLPDDDKLLTTASKHYIELAVISREGVTSKEADEFTMKSLHGLTEEILRKKSPIALKHILKPREDGKPVRCVLVEGAPGIGKSTLAWEVCHKWEELDSVKHYELVVLVQLREKRAQEARHLGDLLPYGATINMNEVIAAISRGKSVLIVCDGFDELPDDQRQKGSVYIDLIKGRLLPEATVIVTSRPSVSASLWSLCQHNIDRHLEVIGFTKEDIKRFAESVFSGDILEGFLSYITSNTPIYSMMYIPLNAVIVALIYQDSYDTDTPFPKTMTQLFDALTRALVRRHFMSTRQVCTNFRMPPSLHHMEDISKLPSLVPEQFLKLTRMAYKSLSKKKYVFTGVDEDFDPLGMLKKTTSLNVHIGCECSYTFFHLTLQEYMAALHIALVYPSDFDLDWLKYEHVVMRFLAGICSHNDYHSHPLHLQLVQQLGSNVHLLQLIRCAYECPSIMHSAKFSETDFINVRPSISFDWYVTGYCMSHFDKRWEVGIPESTTEENIDFLIKGLMSFPITNGSVHFVFAVGTDEFKSGTKMIAAAGNKLIKYWNLNPEKLTISSALIQPLEALVPKITSLTCLEIADYVSDSDLPVLTNIVQSHPTLEVLVLEDVNGTALPQLVVSPGILKKLTVSGQDITGLFPHKIKNVKKLTIPSICCQPLAALLPSTTSLTYLEITGHVADSDLPVLTNVVQLHPTLEVLVIGAFRDILFSVALVQLVMSPGNLKELTVSGQNITGLFPHKIKNVKKLTIPSNCCQPLAALLPSTTSLTYLEITGHVSDSDLPVLTKLVQSHPALEVLDISWVDNSTELSSLIEAAGSSQLKKLTIDQCDIIELLNYESTNPKELVLSGNLLQPLSSLLLNITSLTYLKITDYVSDSDLSVLTKVVQSHPTLEVLNIHDTCLVHYSTELPSLVEAASSSQLKKLTIDQCDIIELLNYESTNPKELIISGKILQLLSSLLLNITSLTYLKITGDYLSDSIIHVLTNIVQSNPTLEVLEIKEYIFFGARHLSSLVIAADNSQLKELRLHKRNYDQLPSHIREAHKHLLKPQLSGE